MESVQNYLLLNPNDEELAAYVEAITQQYADAAIVLAGELYQDITGNSVYMPNGEIKYRSALKIARDEIADKVGVAIRRAANNTITGNAQRDGKYFARVIAHNDSCSFCKILSGRGFVYSSAYDAELNGHNHPNCRCIIVPGNSIDEKIEGYDFDSLESFYKQARKEAGSGDFTDIVNAGRRLDYDNIKDARNARRRELYAKKQETFNSLADPAYDVMGSAEDSHPSLMESIISDLVKSGGYVNYRPGDRESIAYGASAQSGKPGNIVATRGMSAAAWVHEYQHFVDDRKRGYPGMGAYLANPSLMVEMETSAYDAEIAFLRKEGYNKVAKTMESIKAKAIRDIKKGI